MASTFFSTASIGSVSTVILFLMTFLPYIIIISLGAVLSSFGKFLASLSLSTAFCFCWHYILRVELQEKKLTFSNAFSGDFAENDFKFGLAMIVFDIVLYAVIGYFVQKYTKDDSTFYKVERKNLGNELGAQMTKVTKIYEGCDPNKPAVDNVTLAFKKNEILTLLGRNGAGKSTIIKLLTGQVLPSFGEIHLPLDYDIITGFKNPQEQIGLCSQNNILIPNLTAQEHLELYAKLKLRKGFAKEVRRVMTNMKLGKYKNYKVCELSGGYKRRLCIAIAFLGSPNLVILDEPCSGIDTHARKTIWELIEALRKNRAVVLATHDLDEAQHLGDNIIIMKDGRIALQSTTKDLQNELTKNFTLSVELKASLSNDKDIANDVKDVIMTHTEKVPAIINLQDCNLSAVISYGDSAGNFIE
jgi:ABC-type multidrug transport system ATPase subunit